ncbi:hypothetical protein H5410_016688 [Solanum commersonii]|uniref:Uncharacterized protein n=1 Tax=Solanum commersonii TaxID=4109 RepID=A0A9J5ZX94_SOLCO|nr:hypothetical protein H5410_016688 [Solanum commersonii]
MYDKYCSLDNVENPQMSMPQVGAHGRWRARETQFPKLSRMVKDVLAIHGSSLFRGALQDFKLETTYIQVADWINAERRNQGLPKLDSQFELFIDSAIGCGSDDDMELQDRQRALPRPVVDYGQSIVV